MLYFLLVILSLREVKVKSVKRSHLLAANYAPDCVRLASTAAQRIACHVPFGFLISRVAGGTLVQLSAGASFEKRTSVVFPQ